MLDISLQHLQFFCICNGHCPATNSAVYYAYVFAGRLPSHNYLTQLMMATDSTLPSLSAFTCCLPAITTQQVISSSSQVSSHSIITNHGNMVTPVYMIIDYFYLLCNIILKYIFLNVVKECERSHTNAGNKNGHT
jgi:hypothetical protein